tara:strand:- start:5272 stop:5622 length:351 start_codon:yes stop_codon:yes gene_type:complete
MEYNYMKKSFSLIITIFLISIFSYLAVSILETKSLRNTNLQNQYLYIQAKNHKEFLKAYLNSINLNGIENLSIKDDFFEIYTVIKKETNSFEIDLFVKSKKFDISLYESFTKIKTP